MLHLNEAAILKWLPDTCNISTYHVTVHYFEWKNWNHACTCIIISPMHKSMYSDFFLPTWLPFQDGWPDTIICSFLCCIHTNCSRCTKIHILLHSSCLYMAAYRFTWLQIKMADNSRWRPWCLKVENSHYILYKMVEVWYVESIQMLYLCVIRNYDFDSFWRLWQNGCHFP